VDISIRSFRQCALSAFAISVLSLPLLESGAAWADGDSAAVPAASSPSTSASTSTSSVSTTGKPATADFAANIDPDKKAAIRELLTITKMTENAQSIQDMMINMLRRAIDVQLQRRIQADTVSSDSQKKAMQATLSDDSDRIIGKYRKLSKERIDISALMEQVGYKVYDESFTTAEINDLIAFYRTPTGQKAMKELPGIMKRSMTLTAELITPKVLQIFKEITADEMDHLKQDASKLSPQTSKP